MEGWSHKQMDIFKESLLMNELANGQDWKQKSYLGNQSTDFTWIVTRLKLKQNGKEYQVYSRAITAVGRIW